MDKPIVKINFADFGDSESARNFKEYFKSCISTFATVEISENPDFLLCGFYGDEHWNYDCVKIRYETEELEPDFNIFDYAFGLTEITMHDRYLWEPQYLSERFYENTKKALEKHKHTDEYFLKKEKFCNFIYSNGNADKFREDTFYALNDYKHVDSAGKFLNNMGSDQIAGERYGSNWEESKINFMQNYRFTIAFSNAQKFDYVDEKIFDAWNAGTIPIFWGDPKFCEKFNTKAYIDCCDCKTVAEVVERVKEIDQSPEKYLAMQKEPILYQDSEMYKNIVENQAQKNVTEFFKHIMLQEPKEATRISSGVCAKIYRRDMKMLAKIKHNFFYRLLRKFLVPQKKSNKAGEN